MPVVVRQQTFPGKSERATPLGCRVIFNNDGYEMTLIDGADTPDGFLTVRMKATLDTQVDSVFMCTGATTMFHHQAKAGETYGKYAEGMVLTKNIRALKDNYNTDSLAIAVKFCHENDLEVFFTHRANDIHDSFEDFELSTWKREHPEYLLGKREDRNKYPDSDPRNRWSALNFEIPEVRDHLLAIYDDVLARYDVDGIEIDYLRNPLFFRPNLEFRPATSEQVNRLTDFQQGVRDLAYKHGNRRGRPILVTARVPVTKRLCRYIGIDIERWLKEDCLDLLTVGVGCHPFTRPRDLIELGHAHDVLVYPCIAGSTARPAQRTQEHFRGAAAICWHGGADGVYLFNTYAEIFDSKYKPLFTELGDPVTFSSMDKIFCIDHNRVVDGGIEGALLQHQILPLELDGSGRPLHVTLPVADDVAKERRLKLLTLRFHFEGKDPGEEIEVRLNGDLIESTKEDTESGWVTYAADPSQYRHGDNALALRVSDWHDEERPVFVNSVELRVDYH